MVVRLITIVLGFSLCAAHAQVADDLSEALMQATVKLQYDGRVATGFMLLRPLSNSPQGKVIGKVVLVTAKHVLEEATGSSVTVVLHEHAPDGSWRRHKSSLPIRIKGKKLWVEAEDADIAVMYVLPDIAPFDKAPLVDLLVNRGTLKSIGIAPGSELKCLGFPLGFEGDAAGFPILRAGDVASYPFLPAENRTTFLMDFRVFEGNSGGPVYYSPPTLLGSGTYMGRGPQFIVGLLSKEFLRDVATERDGRSFADLKLLLGEVVHAEVIRAAIEKLPKPEEKASDELVAHMSPIH